MKISEGAVFIPLMAAVAACTVLAGCGAPGSTPSSRNVDDARPLAFTDAQKEAHRQAQEARAWAQVGTGKRADGADPAAMEGVRFTLDYQRFTRAVHGRTLDQLVGMYGAPAATYYGDGEMYVAYPNIVSVDEQGRAVTRVIFWIHDGSVAAELAPSSIAQDLAQLPTEVRRQYESPQQAEAEREAQAARDARDRQVGEAMASADRAVRKAGD